MRDPRRASGPESCSAWPSREEDPQVSRNAPTGSSFCLGDARCMGSVPGNQPNLFAWNSELMGFDRYTCPRLYHQPIRTSVVRRARGSGSNAGRSSPTCRGVSASTYRGCVPGPDTHRLGGSSTSGRDAADAPGGLSDPRRRPVRSGIALDRPANSV